MNTAVDPDTLKVVLDQILLESFSAKAVVPEKTDVSSTALDLAKDEVTLGVVSIHIGVILTNTINTETVRVASNNEVDPENVNVR